MTPWEGQDEEVEFLSGIVPSAIARHVLKFVADVRHLLQHSNVQLDDRLH